MAKTQIWHADFHMENQQEIIWGLDLLVIKENYPLSTLWFVPFSNLYL